MNDQLASTGRELLSFIHECGVLKNTRRTGWQWRGISQCESIADHCFRVVLLSMTLGDALIDAGEELNMEKLLRMAILHEICEVRTGDIPYPAVRYLGRDVKKNAEKMAVRDMVASLGNWGSHYGEVFESFENGEGLEAEVVRAADKLEMLLQAFEYELCGHGGLQDFWDNEDTFADIEINEFLTLLLAQLRKVREKKLEEGSSRWDDFA